MTFKSEGITAIFFKKGYKNQYSRYSSDFYINFTPPTQTQPNN